MAADLAVLKINEAHSHLEKIVEFEKKGINGAGKLKKRIQAEINFLQKGLENSGLEEKYVQCSNLGQLGALADVACDIPNVTGILQPFRNEDKEKIVIDIVGDYGKKWIKVIMRNPKALHLLFVLGRRGNSKPLNEVADDFIRCTELHPVFYCPPKIVFWFCNGVSEGLARSIEDKGAAVNGKRIPDEDLGLPDFSMNNSDSDTEESDASSCCSEASEDEVIVLSNSNESSIDKNGNSLPTKAHSERPIISVKSSGITECDISPQENINFSSSNQSVLNLSHSSFQNHYQDRGHLSCINLDVTAMIAYVSATANGGANFIFQDKFLNEQAACERENPVKKLLHEYFEGKELVACKEAVDRFQNIVNVIGGEGEKTRAKDLLGRLTVVPDQDFFKDKVRAGGKIRALPRITFGTGHALHAITVTSNTGFIRAAQCQGISLAVLLHQPRALTENKESQATPLADV